MIKPSSFIVYIVLAIFLLSIPFQLSAKQPNNHGIALVVDDEMISYNDVDNRVKMTLVTSGIEQTQEPISNELRSKIMQIIIDEKLYLQEADRLGITISEAELNLAIRNLEKKNALPEGSFYRFIESKQLDQDMFIEQLKAQIAWSKIIASKIRPRVSVTEQEIDEEFERIISASGTSYEVNFSEIIIQKKKDEKLDATQKRALEIYNQIIEGNNFSTVAKENSDAPNASNGGKIGWIEEDFLISTLKQELSKLKPSEISKPFATTEGFTILQLHDKRKKQSLKEQQESMTEIILHQLFVPHKTIKSQSTDIPKTLAKKRSDLKNCQDIETLKTEMSVASPTKPVHVTVNELHEDIKPVIRKLDVNTPSDVINSPMGVHIFMVCDKRNATSITDKMPNKNQLREQIMQNKVALEARQYLRNLRRDAYIEIRVSS